MGRARWTVLVGISVAVGLLLTGIPPLAATAGAGSAPRATDPSSPTLAASSPATAQAACPATSSLLTAANDPSWAEEIQNTRNIASNALADGLPSTDLRLPYLGEYPDQVVNGVPETGVALAAQQCGSAGQNTAPAGVAYDGQSDRNGEVVDDPVLDSNSLLGTLTVNSSNNFYPSSGTPNYWGAQLNAVLANVTILGVRGYDFWVQNVISYDTFNDTISFVDDTWNFTSYTSEMQPSSLVSWSPNGSDYTGTWVAFSQYYYAPPPFTAKVYVNSSVNAAGDQVLWYNYTLLADGHFYHASYDDLVFRSQANPSDPRHLAPAPFEASATTYHLVNEGYEFDAFIGADDGSNQLMLAASGSETLRYCSIADCTAHHFRYANIPAAVNYGSQTGEETVGIAVNYVGTTAYLSAGPLILHGLWNFTGAPGIAPGNVEVTNDVSVSGSPDPGGSTPYFFAFFEDSAYAGQSYQWAPDVTAWYLMPGTYRYELMLSDYQERQGTLVVGDSGAHLSVVLPYSPASGVYTPLWAFGDGQLAGISSTGTGTIHDQYVLFNNPTSNCSYCGRAANGELSRVFYAPNDYTFQAFPGLFLDGTHAYVDVNRPPSFSVGADGLVTYDLNLQFFETRHVTLSNAAAIGGWSAQEEISFYITVPASQNPVPAANVYVWNSTDDLIMGNTFVAAKPLAGDVSPDGLVLYGGTDNVVWGNTFRDPPGIALGRSYAGLGEAESGDLIFNNNFSVDNPIVLLPYNFPNVADCLPQCEERNLSNTGFYEYPHDTWNVPPEPASEVARRVNGFALTGNVLGPGYTVVGGPDAPTQGGNFYWNFGDAPNNRTTIPYVARFYYSDWSNIYPLGCGTIQAPGAPCGTAPAVAGAYEDGIVSGGDYAPIIPIPGAREAPVPIASSADRAGAPTYELRLPLLGTIAGGGTAPIAVGLAAPATRDGQRGTIPRPGPRGRMSRPFRTATPRRGSSAIKRFPSRSA